jgi:hypothetical protein
MAYVYRSRNHARLHTLGSQIVHITLLYAISQNAPTIISQFKIYLCLLSQSNGINNSEEEKKRTHNVHVLIALHLKLRCYIVTVQ